jgi:BCD family chlorophyll transporter-like MFS transporter
MAPARAGGRLGGCPPAADLVAHGYLHAAARTTAKLSRKWLPFSDVASAEFTLGRLFRLSLFQLSVGMVQTLFVGTMNRVMILELSVPASLVAVMLAIPLLVAPFRALVGFRSDTHRSVLGWKRVPYLWAGTLMQFSGLSIMPFALLVLSERGGQAGNIWMGYRHRLSFLLVGAGAHTTQTAGLAPATDVVDEEKRPRVVALMYLMMLLGTLVSALILEGLLRNFSPFALSSHSGTALFTIAVNLVSLWKQEARVPGTTPYQRGERRPMFREAWRTLRAAGRRFGCWWRPGSVSSPSTCRMCCSSRMVARFWGSQSRRPRS